MKKITLFSLHLGYGGIESAIKSFANNVCDDYDIEIVSVYKLYDKEVIKLNKKIKVKYLIENDIALKTNVYKNDLKSLRIFKFFKDVFKEYKLNIFRLFKDTYISLKTLINKKRLVINYIKIWIQTSLYLLDWSLIII